MVTYEKIWDFDSGKAFWYNHVTKVSALLPTFLNHVSDALFARLHETRASHNYFFIKDLIIRDDQASSWYAPYLIIRYGDVEMPSPWVAIVQPDKSADTLPLEITAAEIEADNAMVIPISAFPIPGASITPSYPAYLHCQSKCFLLCCHVSVEFDAIFSLTF